MKSHLQSYPCPLQINFFWNLGFLLGVAIILQIITGIFLALHYTSDLNSAYFSIFFLIREVYYGWCLRYLHSSGASFVFLFLFPFDLLFLGLSFYFYFIFTFFFLFLKINKLPLPKDRKIPEKASRSLLTKSHLSLRGFFLPTAGFLFVFL